MIQIYLSWFSGDVERPFGGEHDRGERRGGAALQLAPHPQAAHKLGGLRRRPGEDEAIFGYSDTFALQALYPWDYQKGL